MILRIVNHEHIDKTIRRNFTTGIIASVLVFIGVFVYYWINPPRIDLNNPSQNRAGYRTGQRVMIDAKIIDGDKAVQMQENGENFTIYVLPELSIAENGLDFLSGFNGMLTDTNADNSFNTYINLPEEQKQASTMIHVEGYLQEIDDPHGIIAQHTFEDKIEIYMPMCVTSDPKDSTVAYVILFSGLGLGLYSSASLFFAFRKAEKEKNA